ncbi:MAG: hypothetical protein AAFZ11_12105 [Pseudomonadota bacterium]
MEWDSIGLAVVLGLAVYGFGALAGAALGFVFLPRLAAGLRSFIACLSPPVLVIGPMFVIAIIERGPPRLSDPEFGLMVTVLIVPAFIVGYPLAFLLTRALDRRRMPPVDVFR